MAGKHILAGGHGHHDFFQSRIAGSFAQTIDSAFNLPGAIEHGGKRVGDRQTQIVMAMDGEDRLVRVRNALAQLPDGPAELIRQAVADRVRNIQRRGAGVDNRFENPAQKILFGTPGVLRGKLDIVRILPGALDRLDRVFDDLLRRHAEFQLHVDRRRGDERMNSRSRGIPERLARTIDILVQRPRQTANGAVLDDPGDGLHALEIARTGCRETSLDNIDPQALQGSGYPHLFFPCHGGAGTLFTVAQGRIENDEFFAHVSHSEWVGPESPA